MTAPVAETTAAPTTPRWRFSRKSRSVRPAPPLPSLRMVEYSSFARVLARSLAFFLAVCAVALVFINWRQSVYGYGRVIARDPLDRETRVESPIYGRVQEWFVSEGTYVEEGQVIARISDNDSQYLSTLRAQETALETKRDAATQTVEILALVVDEFTDMLEQALDAADQDIKASEAKISALGEKRNAINAKLAFFKSNRDAYSRAATKGIVAGLPTLEAEMKFLEAQANLAENGADIAGAQSDLAGKRAKRAETDAKLTADIRKNEAEIQKAVGLRAEYEKDLQEIGVKIRRQLTQEVTAPRSGRIMRLLVNKQIEQLKDGDPIAILIPEAKEMAVELYLDGNDIPLVRVNDPVRLQFEGWPALQFVGWPSAAVGTFGGKVALIDPADNGKGKFRIVVVPEKSCCQTKSCATGDDGVFKEKDCWPDSRYLRQGVRAKGWALLREVPLWWEVWRLANGFPITVADNEPWSKDTTKKVLEKDVPQGPDLDDKDKDKVKIKLPK